MLSYLVLEDAGVQALEGLDQQILDKQVNLVIDIDSLRFHLAPRQRSRPPVAMCTALNSIACESLKSAGLTW
jgi:hypothetical protein